MRYIYGADAIVGLFLVSLVVFSDQSTMSDMIEAKYAVIMSVGTGLLCSGITGLSCSYRGSK